MTIRKCDASCGGKSHTQDEIHGIGNRVWNECIKRESGHTTHVYRCTVCGKEQKVVKQSKD